MISGIVMASGFSRRMGENKLLLEVDGDSLLERILLGAKLSRLDRVFLVYREDEVGKLGEKLDIETIYNEKAYLGQSESVKKGIEYADINSNYMFLVGDQPFLDSKTIDFLIEEFYKNRDKILVPFYKGKRGMPTIFPNKYRNELLDISGDKGGREIIDNNIEDIIKLDMVDSMVGLDIDERKDLERIKKLLE